MTILLIGISDESFADKRIKLHLEQTISTNDLKFTFLNVSDSRCPSDITCVWAGHVTATIRIENQTHTNISNLIPDDSPIFFSPYKIILLDVSPYPTSMETSDDHIATLAVYGLDGRPPCEKHMTVKEGLCVTESPRPLDFRESGGDVGLLYSYSSLGFVGIVIGFFMIKKWRNRK